MSARTRASQVVAVLPAVVALLWLGPVRAADDAGHAAVAAEQWIAPLPDDLDLGGPFGEVWRKEQMSRWVVWPSDEYIAARQPPKDRSQSEDDPQGWDEKRWHDRPRAPDRVRSEARSWVKEALRPEWLPPDLDERLVLLQGDDPAQSSAICRFVVEGTSIQVTQRRWAMCVVVTPNPALLEGVGADQMGPTVMRTLFAHGDAMALVSETERSDLAPGLWVAGDGGGRWWHWIARYTDGASVAIYFSKLSFDRQEIVLPGDPWF